jgi:NTP pyrophosphatase (non-canonical NTP hydrolase)
MVEMGHVLLYPLLSKERKSTIRVILSNIIYYDIIIKNERNIQREDYMPKEISINKLQEYIKNKDFNPNLKQGYLLKLVEEVGELAEAMRKDIRMKENQIKDTIEEELYDVLYYVLALANIYDINLEESIILKEKINKEKYQHQYTLDVD